MVIARQIAQAAIRVSKMDKRGWDKLYFGIRNDIKQGIRHGSAIGGVIGSFITGDTDTTGGGSIPKIRSKFKANKFRQEYRRRNIPRRYSRNSYNRKPCGCC